MSDFSFDVGILRDQMVNALTDNPEQLAYVLMELADQLPGTSAMQDMLDHMGNTDSDASLPEAAAFFRPIADRLDGVKVLWRAPETYSDTDDLVLVLCQVTLPETDDFPRAGEMPVSSGDHAVGEMFISIGHANEDGDWYVAGWDMNQDCWIDARCFVVKGWQPLGTAAQIEVATP